MSGADQYPANEDTAAEGSVMWWLRTQLAKAFLRHYLSKARFRLALITVLTAVFWISLFSIFVLGLQFIREVVEDVGLYQRTLGALLGTFFASIMMMLVFSTGIILYSTLYDSKDADWFLTLPVRSGRLVLHKYQEALALSSWGFFVLGSPLLVALGLVSHSPWYFYLIFPWFLVAFVTIPGGIGALLCLIVVRWLPGRTRLVLIATSVIAVLYAGVVGRQLLQGPRDNVLTPAWISDSLGRLNFAQNAMLPSWWLASGLLHAASPQTSDTVTDNWSESLLFLSVLTANGLMLHQIVSFVGEWLYRDGYSRLHTARISRVRRRVAWVDRLTWLVTSPLPLAVRLLVLKDARTFRRDPAQWSQFLIFFGLLLLYFFNIRRYEYGMGDALWVHTISFLNLTVVALILSTFTARFIFPAISLEGQRLWILALLPLRRSTILWAKFVFTASGSAIPCLLLVLISDLALQMQTTVVLVHQLTCLALCLGLAGIAIGLGAIMPDLREPSPSKIASGFGGTLNLVVSIFYIFGIVATMALPALIISEDYQYFRGWMNKWGLSGQLLFSAGMAAGGVLCLVSVLGPMWLGARAFEELEG